MNQSINMSKSDSSCKSDAETLNVDFMRSLVKQYSELGQWTSALFWADAAAAAASVGGVHGASGDDIWLLASAMLARGELHRAAHTVTSRGLHKRHLLCVGVAARALLAAKEPASVLSVIEECDAKLLEPCGDDQTHNRALAAVLVTQARALYGLDRREAAAETLATALKTDTACYEALDLLLERHSLTPAQERELLDSLPLKSQLAASEAAYVRVAYLQRVQRYHEPQTQIPLEIEQVRSRSSEGMCARARRLAATCRWVSALGLLDSMDPWCCADVRAACLVELKKTTTLFTFAHTLVDAYPQSWTAWFAVGCYYYLIDNSELARRYMSKAKSLEPSAGCIWLAYGHSFAADNEHDQAMAAYFKAAQLMPGSHLPLLYLGVESTLLNNISMAERFLLQSANIYTGQLDSKEEVDSRSKAKGLALIATRGGDAHVSHEAGAAAFAAGNYELAERLFLRALSLTNPHYEVSERWATTLDALGHTVRKLGRPSEALPWHERALSLRPRRASSLTAVALCHALLRQEARAADALHAALARDPDDAVALALLDTIVDRLDATLSEQDVPQFPFPAVHITRAPPAPPAEATPTADVTNVSDMSMSFD